MNTPVSFELAKLLKENGFNRSTQANWWILAKDHSENYEKNLPVDETKIFFTKDSEELSEYIQIDEEREHNVYHVLGVPTIADVVMWLYEKHGIWISVEATDDFTMFCFRVRKKEISRLSFNYSSPTEAYEAAILYTSNNLV